MRKIALGLIALNLSIWAAPGTAQDAGPAYLTVFEPIEWAEDAGTVAARAGTLMRVRGLAFHPAGIRTITIAGEPAEREEDPSGATMFTGYVTAVAGLETVEVVLEPRSGAPLLRVFGIAVEGGAPAPGPVDAEPAAMAPTRAYNPVGALAGGLVVPGFGQFYTGRPLRGVLHLAGAAGAAGIAFALSNPGKLECNEFNECREVEARSDLTPIGLGAAAAIAVLGAVEAWSYARRHNASAQAGRRGEGLAPPLGPQLRPPALAASPSGVRLELIRITH